MITGTVAVFNPRVFSISISRSLHFEFSTVFKEVFLSVGIHISMSRQVLSFLPFATMSDLFPFNLFVSLNWHVPEYSRCLFFFCHSSWFMFMIVLILYFDVIMFAYCPVDICCSLIVYYTLSWQVHVTRRQGGQLFLEIAHRFCTWGQCHFSGSCFDSNWS